MGGDWKLCNTDTLFPCKRDIFGLQPTDTLEVVSAFDGLALYKTSRIGDCRYDGKDPTYNEDCEHVSFHKCLRKHGGRVMMSGLKIPTYWVARVAGENYHSWFDLRAQLASEKFNSTTLLKLDCAGRDDI